LVEIRAKPPGTCAPSPVRAIYSLDKERETQLKPESPELLPGTLYLLVLRTLLRGPMHGYAIARRIKQCSSDVLSVEEGSLYPALNRMLVKGWLTAEWGTSENNRKARFYRLTAEGRTVLRREEKQFESLVEAILQVMHTA
jgi:PadR family transcriptional regulator, regulatory protein PadR